MSDFGRNLAWAGVVAGGLALSLLSAVHLLDWGHGDEGTFFFLLLAIPVTAIAGLLTSVGAAIRRVHWAWAPILLNVLVAVVFFAFTQ